MFLHKFGKIKAPEFPRGLVWLNSAPLTLKSLRGKVVLIDIWTYSCWDCLCAIPFLKKWYKQYGKNGLIIIGAHTPEFDFEKEQKNVRLALKKFGIVYPIVLDNYYKIWSLYANRWRPRKFVLDADGAIVFDHIGEGGYAETEAAIQKALMENGAKDLPAIAPDLSLGGGICYRTTPETYLGFLRGRFGNVGTYIPGMESIFTDTGEHEDDVVYLHGHWFVEKEHLSRKRRLAVASEYLLIRYSAFFVNLVTGSTDGRVAEIEVLLDDQSLPANMAGADVEIEQGRAYLKIKEHRLYQVINSQNYHHGILKLRTGADNIALYAMTFGGCREIVKS